MKKTSEKFNNGLMIFLVIIMNIPTAMALDQYAPSLPAMAHNLHASAASVQLSISAYMLACGIATPFLGPLSDRFGRRPVIIISIPFFLLGSFFCIFATSISILLTGRIIQGAGIASCSFLGATIMSDIFEGKMLNRVSSYFAAAYSIVPIIAPVIGGYLQEWYGWRANFIFLFLLVSVFYLIFVFKLPETHAPTIEHRLKGKQIYCNYLKVFLHRNYLLSTLCMILTWSIIISFSIKGPFLIQNGFGFSASEYGLLALIVGVGYITGTLLNSQLVKYFNPHILIKSGIIISFIFAFGLLILCLIMSINVWTVMIATFVIVTGAGMTCPNYIAIAVNAHPDLAGTSMALMSSLLFVGTTLVTAILTCFHAHSSETLAGIFTVLIILCTLSYFCMSKKID